MASTLKSLLNNTRKRLVGTSPGSHNLFPRVDSQVDGEDCNHDCASCEVKLPRGWSIDETDKLYGFVKGWSTHVLVATGKTDWVRDVKDEKGSVMEAFGKCEIQPSNGRLMLSASNIPTPTKHNDYSEPTSVLLLPAFNIVENVTPASVPELITSIINSSPTNMDPLPSTTEQAMGALSAIPDEVPVSIPAALPDPLPTAGEMITRPCPHSAVILLCSQGTRDARCGQSAPLLKKEMDRHLRTLRLYRDFSDERPGGVGIYFISHVGGHKYSANMMVYRRINPFGLDNLERGKDDEEKFSRPKAREAGLEDGAAQCIWLARVRPEDCEGILKFTVLQGKVVKPERQLRGGFDREKGLVSW